MGQATISACRIPRTCQAPARRQASRSILAQDVPIKPVLASPPQEITSPLATEAADSSFTGIDFVPAFLCARTGAAGRGAVCAGG